MIYPILTYSRNNGDFSYDLAALHQCGLKGIRLIYKGKSEAEFNLRIEEIQEQISHSKLDIDILIDLPGNKPIVGDLQKGLHVVAGVEYQLVNQGSQASLPVIPTAGFFGHDSFSKLTAGDIISIADDELNLVIREVREGSVLCEALNSFHLTSNRSISVKNKPFTFEPNSERDIAFVRNMKHVHDNVKLLVSFTKKAGDILTLKALQPLIDIIPKIETVLDDASLIEIMGCCKTILLGRGDLSTSSQANELFIFQKSLIELCKLHGKQMIVGTGLLASIGDNKTPTISEVTDYGYLRNAGVDAFLISGSNAHNKPFETLEFMQDFERQVKERM
jgi:pyruvate kinase